VKLRSAIAAHHGPDVVSVFPGIVAQDYRDGLRPLESLYTPTQRKDLSLLNISAGPDGHTYAVPWTAYGYFMYYNKALFKKAGLSPTSPPKTWAQLLTACDKLKAAGIVPISAGFKDGYDWEWYAFPLLDQLMSRSDLVKWNHYGLAVTSPPFKKTWEYIAQLNQRGCFTPHSEAIPLYNDAYDNFYGGKAAMFLGTGVPADIYSAEKGFGKTNVGIFIFPRVPDSKWAPFIDMGPNAGLGITTWSKNPKEAWEYASFLLSAHGQDVMWTVSGQLPNNRAVKARSSDPVINQILQTLKNPLNHTTYMGFPLSVLQINEKLTPQLITGDVSIDSVLQQMERVRDQLKSHYTK
jgi:ABC-type glycerol-3-phosphate transport system substrate-binding protein